MISKERGRARKLLRVGITGHRPNRIPERHRERIKQDLADVMSQIQSENPKRPPVLLSGLAEGADRLAAFVALGLGWPLHTILAFHRTRFEEDFPQPFAKGEFQTLLDASKVIEEPRETAHSRRPPEDGYEAVGRALVAKCDVMIAIWDGEGSRGRGGTIEVIERARAKGTPVIWIHAKKNLAPQHLQPAKRIVR